MDTTRIDERRLARSLLGVVRLAVAVHRLDVADAAVGGLESLVERTPALREIVDQAYLVVAAPVRPPRPCGRRGSRVRRGRG